MTIIIIHGYFALNIKTQEDTIGKKYKLNTKMPKRKMRFVDGQNEYKNEQSFCQMRIFFQMLKINNLCSLITDKKKLIKGMN